MLVLAALVALASGLTIRGRRPPVLVGLPLAAAASFVVWLTVLELTLLRTRLYALGLFLVVAAAVVHATVLFGALSARSKTPLRRVLLGAGVALSMLALAVCAVEGHYRLRYPLLNYELIPDEAGSPPCFFRGPDGRGRATPGYRGTYRYSEFRGVRVEINDYGLRDGLDEAAPPEPGAASVLVLGDSFVYGTGVALEDTLQERVEARGAEITRRPLRVYSGGMPGYSTVHERAMLAELAPEVRPEVVVLGLFEGNDFQDNYYSIVGPPGGLPASAGPLRRFVHNASRFPFWASSCAIVRVHRSALETLLVRAGLMPPALHSNLFLNRFLQLEPPPEVDEVRDVLFRELEGLRDDCREIGAELVVLLIPADIQGVPERFERFLAVQPEAARPGYSRVAFHEDLVARLEERGFRVVDPLARIEAEERAGRPCYHQEGHWNARGNAVAAEALVPALAELLGGA